MSDLVANLRIFTLYMCLLFRIARAYTVSLDLVAKGNMTQTRMAVVQAVIRIQHRVTQASNALFHGHAVVIYMIPRPKLVARFAKEFQYVRVYTYIKMMNKCL